MYGLIVKLTAAPGRRDDVVKLMGGNDSGSIPGCLSFIVATDAANENVVWVTEVWDSKSAHEASLEAPSLKQEANDAEAIIAKYERVGTTQPIPGASHPLHNES